MKITKNMLLELGACDEQIDKFDVLFGDEAEITHENVVRAYRGDLYIKWFIVASCKKYNLSHVCMLFENAYTILQMQYMVDSNIADISLTSGEENVKTLCMKARKDTIMEFRQLRLELYENILNIIAHTICLETVDAKNR